MQGIVITYEGMEDICAEEIVSFLGCAVQKRKCCVIFPIKKLEDLCLLCYRSQSALRVLYMISEFSGVKDALLADIEKFLTKGKSFCVRAHVLMTDRCSRHSLEEEMGSHISRYAKEQLGAAIKVQLTRPDVQFFAFMCEGKGYLGVDFSGFDLSKREYKIFNNPVSLKGPLAYALAQLAKPKKGEILVDPFCGSGTIVIEAAVCAAGFPLRFYQKSEFSFNRLLDYPFPEEKLPEQGLMFGYDKDLRAVSAAKKNAKIAGVHKAAHFSRADIEWLDTKLEEKSAWCIVSNLPRENALNKKELRKAFNEFFYQAAYVMKDNGRIVVCSTSLGILKEAAAAGNFAVTHERKIVHGNEVLEVAVLVKKS